MFYSGYAKGCFNALASTGRRREWGGIVGWRLPLSMAMVVSRGAKHPVNTIGGQPPEILLGPAKTAALRTNHNIQDDPTYETTTSTE